MLKVTSNNRSIVVLGGGNAAMRSNLEKVAMEGAVRVEGRSEKESGILAVTDGRNVGQADVQVVRKEESGTEFETKLVPEVQGDQRAQWSSDYQTLRIMGEHGAVKPFLGDASDRYPGQNSPQFRVLLAELVTDAVVRRVLTEKYREDELDAATFYVEHYRLTGRFLARAHRVVAAADQSQTAEVK